MDGTCRRRTIACPGQGDALVAAQLEGQSAPHHYGDEITDVADWGDDPFGRIADVQVASTGDVVCRSEV